MQALKVCPVRPRVQFGESSSAKSLVQLGNTFNQSGCGCLKKCLQLSILLPLPSHKLHTFPKNHKKKKLGNNFVREAEGCRWELKARNSAVQLWTLLLLHLKGENISQIRISSPNQARHFCHLKPKSDPKSPARLTTVHPSICLSVD